MFLDKASLAASADLPQALREALQTSRKFLVLCSPEAARSPWVAREARTWLETHGPRNVLLVLTAGRLTWRNGDFDREQTDALPEPFYGAFAAEPLWANVTWSRGHADPARAAALRATVAQLAAAVLELPLDEIEGDDVRSRRLLRRLRTAAIGALVLLATLSAGLGLWAEINRRTAVRQRQVATERALAISAQATVAGTPSLANAQRAAAYVAAVPPSSRGPETWAAALAALQSLPTAVVRHQAGVSGGAFAAEGAEFALSAGRTVSRYGPAGRLLWTATLSHDADALAWAPSGRMLLAAGRSRRLSLLRSDGSVVSTMPWNAAAGATATTEPAIREMAFPTEDLAVIATSEGFIFVDVPSVTTTTQLAFIDRLTLCGGTATWSLRDGSVMSQHLASAHEPRLVHRHRAPVAFLACSSDGASVASVGTDDEVVWSRSQRSSRWRVHGVRSLALAPAGDRLAINTSMVLQSGRLDVGGRNETLLFADGTGVAVWRATHALFSSALAFHHDDLLVADDKSAILRVDARHLRRVDRLSTPDQIDHLIGLSRPGDVLVVSKTGGIEQVDFVAGTRRPFGRTTGWATKTVVNTDRRSVLLFCRIDGAEINDQREAAVVVATDFAAGPIHFEPRVAAAARPGSSEALSLRAQPAAHTVMASIELTEKQVRQPVRLRGRYESLIVSADGAHVMLSGADGALLVQLNDQEVWRDKTSTTEPVFIGRGPAAVLLSEAPALLLGDGKRVALPFETGNVGTVKVSSDLRFAAVVTDDRHQLWDLASRTRLHSAEPNNSWSAAFAPDGSSFVAAIASGGLDVFELGGQNRVRHVAVPLTIDGEIVFADSGRNLLVPGREGVARVNIETGTIAPVGGAGPGAQIAVAPRGAGLVLSYPNNTVHMYDNEYRRVAQLQLSGSLGAVAFAADGSRVALGSHDGGVRFVDIPTGRLLADIRAETGSVVDLTFLASDKWLLIAGLTRYSVVPLDPYSLLCGRATRSLSADEWLEVGGTGPAPTGCR